MESNRPGDVLGGRYRLDDLLSETGSGRFWRGHDLVLSRSVAIHVVRTGDPGTPDLMAAARRSATVVDARLLRVLDAVTEENISYVVNEWGQGTSLDHLVAREGPLPPRQAAYLVCEVADAISTAHDHGVAHGRLNPENILLDEAGAVRLIGFAVEAAFFGLPPEAPGNDVVDLAALLHFALTGKWAGATDSGVPPCPTDHGRVLRPRQVRAGVPRVLDDLCDTVLNQRGRHVPAPDAAELHRILSEYVGDPTGIAEELRRSAVAPRGHSGAGGATTVLPRVADRTTDAPASGAAATDAPATDASATGADAAAGDTPTAAIPPAAPPAERRPERSPEPSPEPSSAEEVPTELGLPVFDDDSDDVSWFRPRAEKAPPPPPLEPPPPRPLFAPDPPEGEPLRRSRVPEPESHGSGATHSAATTVRSDGWASASGGHPAVPYEDDYDPGEQPTPGKRWLQLAAAVAVALLLVVAIVVAWNLGRGRGPLGSEQPAADASPSQARATPAPVRRLVAKDLDPQGDPPTESADIVGLAVDGDPATAWRTQTYNDQFGAEPPALKSGVGLVLDLRATYDVSSVEVTFDGQPTGLQVFVTDTAPTDVAGLTPAAELQAGPTATVQVEATGRYVTLWLTSLPQVSDGFRAEVSEVRVLGVRSP